MLEELKKLKDVHIGIESISNPITDFLYKNGYKIYNLNPLKIKRFKEMHIVSGNKTDQIDSKYLSEYLRLNVKKLQPLQPSSDLAEQLKEYSVVHDQFTKDHTRLINELTCFTRRAFPLANELFSSSVPKVLLKLLCKYPSWEQLKAVSEEGLIDFLKKNHYRTPKYIDKVINKIAHYDQYVCPRVEKATENSDQRYR